MHDLLENDLREFYAAYDAAYDPVPGLTRVRAREREQVPHRQRLWAALAACATALAGGITAAVLLLSSGASVAYAGWTAVPTTPSPAALASAIAQCKKYAQPLDPALRAPAAHSRADQCDGIPILTDARGKYVGLIYAEDGQMSELVTGGHIGTSGFEGPIPRAPAPSRLTAPAMAVPNPDLEGSPTVRFKREISHLTALERQLHGYHASISALVLEKYHFAGLAQQLRGASDAEAMALVQRRIESMSQRIPQHSAAKSREPQLAYAFGRAGARVSAVTFTFASAKPVKATVENGWYFAWWPWAKSPLAARVMTASGTTTMPLKH
jgi:hypothetical protein